MGRRYGGGGRGGGLGGVFFLFCLAYWIATSIPIWAWAVFIVLVVVGLAFYLQFRERAKPVVYSYGAPSAPPPREPAYRPFTPARMPPYPSYSQAQQMHDQAMAMLQQAQVLHEQGQRQPMRGVDKCPNCGAPNKAGARGQCHFCNAYL